MTNYLVAVFVGGKHVNSYFSDNLDDLITIKALHQDCEIDIFDLAGFFRYSREQVEHEIARSGKRWRRSLSMARLLSAKPVEKADVEEEKPKKKKSKKFWDRPVKCVETGQVFGSIRECCDHLGLSYKSVWNAINSGNGRCGLHFSDVHIPNEKQL